MGWPCIEKEKSPASHVVPPQRREKSGDAAVLPMAQRSFVFNGVVFDLPREYEKASPTPLTSALGPAVVASARRANDLYDCDDDGDDL